MIKKYFCISFFGIGLSVLLFAFFSCSQPVDVDDRIYAPVEYVTILFTEDVVDMPDPYAVVTLDAFTERADSVRLILEQLDPDATIERRYPDYEPGNNEVYDRSKVYIIRFTQPVPFFDIKEPLEELEIVVWVSPPVLIYTDV